MKTFLTYLTFSLSLISYVAKAQNCVADFTYQVSAGTNTVSLTDNSTTSAGSVVDYYWDFGDGVSFSTAMSPTHTYSNAGVYAIKHSINVKVNNQVVCTNTTYKIVNVQVSQAPCSAKFTMAIDPLDSSKVTLTDSTQVNFLLLPGTYTRVEIDFGGPGPKVGASGSTPFPNNQHRSYSGGGDRFSTYMNPGVYYPCLSFFVIMSNGDTICKDVFCDTLKMDYKGTYCTAQFKHDRDALNGLKVAFKNQSYVNSPNALVENYSWDFGDGNSSSAENPNHIYAASGTYQVCLNYEIRDSITQGVLCSSTECKNVYVSSSCQASFVIDTLGSGNGVINVWNTVDQHYPSPQYSVDYLWDFGDGNTSSQAYPSHTYGAGGGYLLCLSISIINNTSNDTCGATFCDSLVVDSLGNLVSKNGSAGFLLNILNPNANISIQEKQPIDFTIFPNPADDHVYLDTKGHALEGVKFTLFNIRGDRVLQAEHAMGNEPLAFDISAMPNGCYWLHINTKRQVYRQKLIIAH